MRILTLAIALAILVGCLGCNGASSETTQAPEGGTAVEGGRSDKTSSAVSVD